MFPGSESSLDSYFLKRMKKNDKFTFHAREGDVIISEWH